MPTLKRLEGIASEALRALEAAYEREVQAALRDALDKMRAELTRIYERYAKAGILTKAEMARYNRLTTLEQQLVGMLNPAIAANLRTIARLRPEQYGAAFYHYAWAIDNGTGLRLAWGVLNKDVILENIANQFLKISVRRYGVDARLRVLTALNQGLSQGKSYQVMARDLKKAINTTYANAIRIIRTEGQAAANAGQEDAYMWAQRKGVEGKIVWSATKDARTRDEHGAMDGQARQDDGTFHLPNGETAPYPGWEGLSAGMKINCRCNLRFDVDGYSPALMRTRDQGIIPYETFDAWKRRYG